jgi:hypothetical protein
VTRGRRPPAGLPWALCCLSVTLLIPGVVWRVAYPEAADDGLVYVVLSGRAFLLTPLVGAMLATGLPSNPYGWLWCAFAARLRTQVDLDEVTEGLRDTVAATVAPTQVAVWLRVPSGTGGM